MVERGEKWRLEEVMRKGGGHLHQDDMWCNPGFFFLFYLFILFYILFYCFFIFILVLFVDSLLFFFCRGA